MGYALFAQRKLVLDGLLQNAQLMQTQRSDEQFQLATQQTSLKQQLGSLTAAQASQLAQLYGELSSAETSDDRNTINDRIKEQENIFKQEQDEINRKVYEVSMKESALEMEVKRLDTVVTKYQKDLEAIEQAEKDGIDRATPKFNGLG